MSDGPRDAERLFGGENQAGQQARELKLDILAALILKELSAAKVRLTEAETRLVDILAALILKELSAAKVRLTEAETRLAEAEARIREDEVKRYLLVPGERQRRDASSGAE